MNILIWKARDLGKPKRKGLLRKIGINEKIDLVGVQQTKKDNYKKRTLEIFLVLLIVSTGYRQLVALENLSGF